MKKFNYNKGNAVIRILKEPKIKKKKFNLDRLLFVIVLLLLCFWLFSFIYKKTVWVEGNGQILMEKVDVNFTNDIRVKDIYIQEGDTVCAGNILFNYFQNDFDSNASLVVKNYDKNEKRQESLQDLLKEISLKRMQLQNLKERLAFFNKQKENITKLILLDVYTKNKLESVLLTIEDLKASIKILQNELYYLYLQKKSTKNASYVIGAGADFGNSYISPITGVIGQILKSSEESCYKTESVMTIHNVEKVFIKAYFNLKDAELIQKGAWVTVEFPDKTTSQGIINKLYIATYKAPTEFQKKYEPTERNILAEIIPVSKEDMSLWAKFHKLNLKVKVGKL